MNLSADALKAFIERIERLESEKNDISEDIKIVYGEAKSFGLDVKIMRKIVSLRKKDDNTRKEEEELMAVYLSAIGDQLHLFSEAAE